MLTEPLSPGLCDTGDRLHRADGRAVEWSLLPGLSPYAETLAAMQTRVASVAAGETDEAVWLLEHPPLYTAGTSANETDLLSPGRFPVYPAGRGGQYTYHGPGQRVVYLMLDLRERGRDVRCLVQGLEGWLIDTLATFGVRAERRPGRIGVWVSRPDKGTGREDKIGAVGVRVSRWVTSHGIALNVAPDLGHFAGIVPCGITDQGVTSLADLGRPASLGDVDAALRAAFERRFGPTSADLVSGRAEPHPSSRPNPIGEARP